MEFPDLGKQCAVSSCKQLGKLYLLFYGAFIETLWFLLDIRIYGSSNMLFY